MSNKCQYPLWGDELPPTDELIRGKHYCNAAAPLGQSYCEEHHEICRVKIDPDAPKRRWDWTGKKSAITNAGRVS